MPLQKYSFVARELEATFPDLGPSEIHRRVTQRLQEAQLRAKVAWQ